MSSIFPFALKVGSSAIVEIRYAKMSFMTNKRMCTVSIILPPLEDIEGHACVHVLREMEGNVQEQVDLNVL